MQKKKLNRDPTMHELYKDLHQHRNKEKQGSWVCKKSEIKLVMLSLSVHTIVSLYIMNAQHVTTDLINMFFVGGIHSKVGTVPQHSALH